MKDFSTILLINILRATVDHVQDSLEIDMANPGLLEFKRTLLKNIVTLQENRAGSQLTVQKGH